MLLPSCRTGGFCSIAVTSPLRSPRSQRSLTNILPRIETDPAGPLRTVTSPEWVSTSRSTGPETCSVRSNVPCGVDAKTAVENTARAIARPAKRAGAEDKMRKLRFLFISERLHGCHFRGALGGIHARGHGDQRKRHNRCDNRNPRNNGMGDKIGQRQRLHRGAHSQAEGEPKNSADDGQHRRLGKKLSQDIALGCPHSFACANLAGALG